MNLIKGLRNACVGLYETAKALVADRKSTLTQLSQLPFFVRGFREFQKLPSPPSRLAPPTPAPNALRSYVETHHSGKGIWKWNHYFDIYDRHFRKFVGRDVRVLEIGVYSGGSLEMWRNYFGANCTIFGVDINEACRAHEDDRTHVFIGDQADPAFWKSFKDQVPFVDVIVDDGGHMAHQQIVTLEEMFPRLRPGGVYLCEDICGVDHPFAAYIAGMAKGLHHFEPDETKSSSKATSFQKWIESIHLYPLVLVMERSEVPVEAFVSERHGSEWQPS